MKQKLLMTVIPVSLLCIFTLTFFFISLKSPAVYRDSEIFKGYYTLLMYSNKENQDKIIDTIQKPFFRNSISFYTSIVYINDFTGEERVPLSELNVRLDKLDPRYDPYLQKLKSYFYIRSGKNRWQVLYIPALKDPISMYIHLHFILDPAGIKWELADFSFLPRLISFLFILFFAFLLYFYVRFPNRIEKYFFSAGLIPWILNVIMGSIGDIVLFFPMFFAWSFIVRNTGKALISHVRFSLKTADRRTLFQDILKLIVIGILPWIIVAVFQKDLSLTVRASLAVIYNVLAASIMAVLLILRIKYMEYNIFEPVQILRTARVWRNSWKFPVYVKKMRIITFAVLVISAPIVFTIVNSINSAFLPVPVMAKKIGKDFNWQNLEILSRSISNDGYPNIADYFTHRAFQEGFPLGMKYKFPGEGEALYLKDYSYSESTGMITGTLRTVKKYDSRWIKKTLSSIPELSVAEMLFKQGEPVKVEYISTAVRVFMLVPVWEILVIIVVFFFFLSAWKFNFALAYDFRRLYEET